MSWLDYLIILFCLVSISINIYIMVYEVKTHYKWFFLAATAFGIFFGFFRLYTVFQTKKR